MKTNNTFILLCAKYLKEEWRRQLILAGVLTIICALATRITVFVIDQVTVEDTFLTDDILLVFNVCLVLLCFLVLSYHTAHSMPFMANKQRHIQYNLLPASKTQKFLSVLVLPIVITIIQCLIAIPLGDLIQYLWTDQSILHLMSTTDMSLKFTPEQQAIAGVETYYETWSYTKVHISTIASLILLHAWALLSATIFRKYPFILGFITYCIGLGLISSLQSITEDLIYFISKTNYSCISSINAEICISITLALAFYVWSYFRMRKAQV